MAKTSTKRIKLERRINQYEAKAKKGMFKALIAFFGCAACIVIKLLLMSQGFEWASSDFANGTIFMIAIIAAGFAGYGAREWMRAKNEIRAIQAKM